MIIVLTNRFKHQVRKSTERETYLKDKIADVLNQLESEPFNPKLHTHKLKGELAGCWSCSVGYEYRIIFEFVKISNEESKIILHSFGTHDDVY